MKYYGIGEKFEYNSKVTEVVKGVGVDSDCDECCFNEECGSNLSSTMYCSPAQRKDCCHVWYRFVEQRKMKEETEERVNHPAYYNKHPSGVECIEIVRHHNFNVGNAIKYLWRQGLKTEEGMSDKDKQIEDLKKAIFYITDEIKRLS